MKAFIEIISARAYREGYAAYVAGTMRNAPAKFGTYSGIWVTGWDAAAMDLNTIAATAN